MEVLSLALRALHGRVSTRLSIALRRVARGDPRSGRQIHAVRRLRQRFRACAAMNTCWRSLAKEGWFCPSCHQKKVQIFGAMLAESILAAVPHRHFTFTIPEMLRPYFRFHRGLLKQLCRIASRASRSGRRCGDCGEQHRPRKRPRPMRQRRRRNREDGGCESTTSQTISTRRCHQCGAPQRIAGQRQLQ